MRNKEKNQKKFLKQNIVKIRKTKYLILLSEYL